MFTGKHQIGNSLKNTSRENIFAKNISNRNTTKLTLNDIKFRKDDFLETSEIQQAGLIVCKAFDCKIGQEKNYGIVLLYKLIKIDFQIQTKKFTY